MKIYFSYGDLDPARLYCAPFELGMPGWRNW